MDGLAGALRGVHTTCLNVITGRGGVFHLPVFLMRFGTLICGGVRQIYIVSYNYNVPTILQYFLNQ